MAGKDSSETKDQPATHKRLRDARKRGQVSQSRELTGAVSLIAGCLGGALLMGAATAGVVSVWQAAERLVRAPTLDQVLGLAIESMIAMALMSVSLMLLTAAVGGLTAFLQVGPVFSFETVKPTLERVSLVANAKNLVSMRTLVMMGLMLFKTVFLGIGVVLIFYWHFPDAVRVVSGGTGAVLEVFRSAMVALVTWAIIGFLVLALLDFAYQRFQFGKDMRMSLSEVKREYKENEGDPIIKSARRQAANDPGVAAQLLRAFEADVGLPVHRHVDGVGQIAGRRARVVDQQPQRQRQCEREAHDHDGQHGGQRCT